MIRRIALLNRTSDRFPAWLSFFVVRPARFQGRPGPLHGVWGPRRNSAGNPNGSLNPVSNRCRVGGGRRSRRWRGRISAEEFETFFREIRMPPGVGHERSGGLILFRP